MSIFPFLNGQDGVEEKKDAELPLYKEIAFDFNRNSFIYENGDFKIVTGNEALKVWIYKAALTERFALDIYSWNYGSDLNSIIGKGFSKEFILTEGARYVKEALMQNEYIKDTKVQEITFINDKLYIKVEIETIYGNMNMQL